MNIEVRNMLDLSKEELQQWRELTLPMGSMWPIIQGLRASNELDGVKAYSRLYLIRDEDGKPAAWAHVWYDNWYDEDNYHTFVRSDLRRQGFGAAIFEKATKDAQERDKKLRVFRWDPTSWAFYDNMEDK